MAREKKKTFRPQLFEKTGNSNLSATLYASMLLSGAYLDLSANAKNLYTYMKLQYYGQREKPNGNNSYFVFNRAMYTKTYQIFKNGEQFIKYCHELIQHGFIDEIECGRITRTKSIYSFSDKWKTWEHGVDYRPMAMQRHDNELKVRRAEQKRLREQGTQN